MTMTIRTSQPPSTPCTHMQHRIKREAGKGETKRHGQRLLVENTVLLLASLVVILTLRASRSLATFPRLSRHGDPRLLKVIT